MNTAITPLAVFEEFRFTAELLAAQLVFAIPFARFRPHGKRRLTLLFALLLAFSQLYLFLPKGRLTDGLPGLDMVLIHLCWYSLLIVLSLGALSLCFSLQRCDLLFIAVASYAVQHIEYALVNELLAMQTFPALPDTLWLYVLLCVASCAGLYALCYQLYARPLRACNGAAFGRSTGVFCFFLALLAVLVGACFTEQHLFRYSAGPFRTMAALLDVLACLLILMVLYFTIQNSRLARERHLAQQLLNERQRQYQMSKQQIDLINHKCHDLKHQILALRRMGQGEQEAFFADVDRSVLIYDSMVQTGSEVLNTLLTEKSLYCEAHHIQLNCMADGSRLAFIDTMDLYTLLGNALDNAIECVSQYPPPQRIISLRIFTQGKFLTLEMSNYFTGRLSHRDGLPVTTKPDRENHGYGLRSMRTIVKKYGGVLEADAADGAFVLEAVIPLPEA